MHPQQRRLLAIFDDLLETARILHGKLLQAHQDNGDGAHEAISVMLMQTMNYFGADSPAFQQLFPAMEQVKRRIDTANYVGAIWAAEDLTKALREIRALIEAGPPPG